MSSQKDELLLIWTLIWKGTDRSPLEVFGLSTFKELWRKVTPTYGKDVLLMELGTLILMSTMGDELKNLSFLPISWNPRTLLFQISALTMRLQKMVSFFKLDLEI